MDLAGTIAKLFIQRRDVYATQFADGHYEPTRQQLTRQALQEHLDGSRTLGHYLVDREGLCRLFAFDIDLVKNGGVWKDQKGELHAIEPRKAWLDSNHPAKMDLRIQLRCLAEGIAVRTKRLTDLQVAIAYSGNKGLHVYGFAGPIQAAESREVAKTILDSFGCFEATRGNNFFKHVDAYPNLEIEIFPKQDNINADGFGNLLRLPLGVNRKSGQAGFFVDMKTGYDELSAMDAETALDPAYSW